MTGPVVSAEGLTKVFGDHRAVDDLTFAVQGRRVTAFLGPNGAGKTTTLRLLLGLARPTSGSAMVLGKPYRGLADPSKRVGVLLDPASGHPRRTAVDHLRWMAAAAGIDDRRVGEMLALVELSHAARRPVGQLSLGMRTRLGLAAALLGEPELLILDEPANGLDPAGMRWLRQLLRDFAASGAVFLSSHQLGEVAQVAEDVVVINRGRLVAQTTVAALTSGRQNLEETFLQLTEEGEVHGPSAAR